MTTEQLSFHDTLRSALASDDEAALSAVVREVRAADIAESFELLDDEDRSRVLFSLPPKTAAEVVVMLDEAVRGDVVEDLDTRSLTQIVSELPPDDAADMLSEFSPEEITEILEAMDPEQSNKIGELLAFEEETAGSIMTPDVVAVPADKTVADAVDYVRAATHTDELHEIYIVDPDGKLVGAVPLRRLVTQPAATRLVSICDPDPVTVYATDDQETVLQMFRKYDVLSAAVLDLNDRLIGRITHDDLLDVAEEEAAEDLYRMAGTDASEFETSSVFRAARIRLTWLIPCMVGLLGTALVLGVGREHFDAVLFGALAMFVPMVGATSGNSGIQISTVIVRGFATGELASTKLSRILLREGRIALLMSVACGVIAFGLVAFYLPAIEVFESDLAQSVVPIRVAMAVGLAMCVAILLAAFLGIALPFTFRRFGIDPAIASGPLVTTMNDATSVAVYMAIALAVAR